MATVKIVLRQKKNKDGAFPLALRITKDRKTSFIHTGYYLLADDWDAQAQRVKKQHTNHARLNNYLIKKLSEATNTSLELETIKTEVSSRAVKQKIKPLYVLIELCTRISVEKGTTIAGYKYSRFSLIDAWIFIPYKT